MLAKRNPTERKRYALVLLLAIAFAASPSIGGLLKKGDTFLPFGLQAIDGTNVIVTLEGGRLTLLREPARSRPAEKIKTHPAAVLIDFWATWCVPCRSSMPYIQKIHDKFRPPDGEANGGLNVFGIALDTEGAAVVKPAFAKLKFTYPMLADPIPDLADPAVLHTAASMVRPYGAEQIPVVYLIDTKGRIVYAHMGFDKDKMADLENAISATVAELKK